MPGVNQVNPTARVHPGAPRPAAELLAQVAMLDWLIGVAERQNDSTWRALFAEMRDTRVAHLPSELN